MPSDEDLSQGLLSIEFVILRRPRVYAGFGNSCIKICVVSVWLCS